MKIKNSAHVRCGGEKPNVQKSGTHDQLVLSVPLITFKEKGQDKLLTDGHTRTRIKTIFDESNDISKEAMVTSKGSSVDSGDSLFFDSLFFIAGKPSRFIR